MNTQHPLQVVIANQRGLDVHALLEAINNGYRPASGARIRANVAQGVHIDGMPMGTIVIEEAA